MPNTRGLVGITANCSVVKPCAVVVIGIIYALVYMFTSKLLVHLKIGDAVDAVSVHFFYGVWGLLATGIFASDDLVSNVYGSVGDGIFYEHQNLFGFELLGITFIIGWIA